MGIRTALPFVFTALLCRAEESRVYSQGTLEIPRFCAVDLDRGKWVCTIKLDGKGAIPPVRDRGSDFWFQAVRGERFYLKPLKRAMFATPDPVQTGKAACASASYAKNRISLDQFKQGGRLCVRTNGGRYSQIELLESVQRHTERLRIVYVTWHP